MTRVTLVILAVFLSAAGGFAPCGGRPQWSSASKPAAKISAEDQARIDKILALAGNHAASADDVAFLSEDLKNSSPLVRATRPMRWASWARRPSRPSRPSWPRRPTRSGRAACGQPRRVEDSPGAGRDPAPGEEAAPRRRSGRPHEVSPQRRGLGQGGRAGALRAALKDDEMAKYACLVVTEIGPDAAETAPELLDRLKNGNASGSPPAGHFGAGRHPARRTACRR